MPRGEALRRLERERRHFAPAPKSTPKVMLARRMPPPKPVRMLSAKDRLALLHKELEAKYGAQLAKQQSKAESNNDDENDNDTDETDTTTTAPARGARPSGGGPVVGSAASSGRGYGIGAGTSSVGILKDPEFLLYYQKVQERIKDAWSFAGGNRNLTTTVNFAIGPDGKLTGLEVAHSSNNASFDQSVERAIRGAAPFPPPPEKYRDQFAQGIQAVFKLGELSS
jgi:TolA protein